MRSYEELRKEWNESTCGREFDLYIYQYFESQFREPSTQGGEEPDFDGPLAMVDHYQRLNKYLTNENARLFNRIRVLEEALKVAIGYLPYNETISGPIKQALNPKD